MTNLLATLTDLRFERLLSKGLIGAVYAVVVALHLLGGLIAVVSSLAEGGWFIAFGLLVVPPATLLGVVLWRVAFEGVAVYFRAAEDLRALRQASSSTMTL